MQRPKVIIRRCAEYDIDRIATIIGEGLDTLELKPFGRTLIKPNAVTSGWLFPNAFTRSEFVEGVAKALVARGSDIQELAVGERCGITVPTRYSFKNAGYYQIAKRVPQLGYYHFDEESQVEIPLRHEGRLRDLLYTPEPVARADFFVNCPKFKAHPWTTVTFSMKNYIGIQDDRHRLIDHDHQLNRKVADLQYIAQPQFIAIDAITAGEGRMLTPLPFDLGLIIMGNNQVAFDAVCSRIIGCEPMEVEHIRLAHERGFGPVDLDQIDIVGDVSLEQAQVKAEGFKWGLVRVEDYFKGTSIRAYGGKPPGDTHDYCWGGCPGALEEAIEILRVYDETTDEKIPPVHIVFGAYEGPIEAKPGEKILFIGDCAAYKGTIAGKDVAIESCYVDRSLKDPLRAKEEGPYLKMLKTSWRFLRQRNDDVIRMKGCPVSVSEQVLAMINIGGLKNPYLDLKIAPEFTNCYLSSKTRRAIKRLSGRSYNVEGPTLRGAANPQGRMLDD